jgi:hypothetical protein
MRVTTFLSRLIGLFAILFAITLIAHRQATLVTLGALGHNPPLLFIFGMVWLAVGLAIVLGHNVWAGGTLPIIITLIGWLILVRGLLFLFLPPAASIGLFTGLPLGLLFYLYTIIFLVFGLYLTYSGFHDL